MEQIARPISHKRCTLCFESKVLDITNFRYKKTEKRWVAKCRTCERHTRNRANARKRLKSKRDGITESKLTTKITGKAGHQQLQLLSNLIEQSLLEIEQDEETKRSRIKKKT